MEEEKPWWAEEEKPWSAEEEEEVWLVRRRCSFVPPRGWRWCCLLVEVLREVATRVEGIITRHNFF